MHQRLSESTLNPYYLRHSLFAWKFIATGVKLLKLDWFGYAVNFVQIVQRFQLWKCEKWTFKWKIDCAILKVSSPPKKRFQLTSLNGNYSAFGKVWSIACRFPKCTQSFKILIPWNVSQRDYEKHTICERYTHISSMKCTKKRRIFSTIFFMLIAVVYPL